MPGFDLTTFMSKVNNFGGIARKNKFTVEITPPTTLFSDIDSSTINFLAKSVSFPARSFGSTTYRSGGRFTLEVPYETTFEPVGLTMLNTNDHAPRKFWNSWFQHIQSVGESVIRTGDDSYQMKYYKKFVGTVKIFYFRDDKFDTNPFQSEYSITLHNAWPKTISAIEVGWENAEFADFDVDIAYSRWTENN